MSGSVTHIYPQNYCGLQFPQYDGAQVFRVGGQTSAQPAVTYPNLVQKPDTVEISGKKKKSLSKGQKWAAGIGGTLAGAVAALLAAGILISKHETGKLAKLYKQKMQLVDLPEKIDFKEAGSVEEGIKFAKEVLKVVEVDKNFTLDGINFVNRGLVEVSNANKGHLFMPKKICYTKLKDDVLAQVYKNVESPRFGELQVNSVFFDEKYLRKELDEILGIQKKTAKGSTETKKAVQPKTATYELQLAEKVCNLHKKYKDNPASLILSELRELYENMINAYSTYTKRLELAPLSTMQKCAGMLKEHGIDVNIEEFAKLTTVEQSEKLSKYFEQIRQETGKPISISVPYLPVIKTIHHEMGHLQDFAKNLKELDIKRWKLPSFREYWKESRNGNKKPNSPEIEYVDNRWGVKGMKKNLFENNPEKFKKQYPDLYEFLTNQQIQQSAGEVSWYAQTGIGEFIAETYAMMIRGAKIPEDVLTLYKKYNGPLIPFA